MIIERNLMKNYETQRNIEKTLLTIGFGKKRFDKKKFELKSNSLRRYTAILSILMLSMLLVSCGSKTEDNGYHTYRQALSASPSNWNELTYQTANDNNIIGYIKSSFFEYDYVFDENGNIVDDAVSVEFSAATAIKDVTKEYAGNENYDVPNNATKGYAYQISLRKDLCWDDGTPIYAEDFVYSMKEQLNPLFQNYRANSYYYGSIVINDAEAYLKQGQTLFVDPYVGSGYDGMSNISFADLEKDSNGEYVYKAGGEYTFEGAKAVYPLDYNSNYLYGYTLQSYEDNTQYFDGILDEWHSFRKTYDTDNDGYVEVTDESRAALTLIVLHAEWASTEEDALAEVDNMMFIQRLYPEMDFSEVGIFAKSKYELVLVLDNPVVLLNDDGSLSYKVAYNLSSLPLVKKDLYEKYKHEPQLGSTLWTTTYNNDVESTASWGPYKLTEYQKGKYYKLVKNEYWYGYDMDEYEGQYQTDEIYTETISDYNTQLLKFKAGELDDISIDVSVADTYRNSSQAVYTKDDFASSLQLQSSYDALKERETEGINKTILTYQKFRKAMSLSINRSAFAQQCTTSNMEGFGLLNDSYYYDVENGKMYRSTDAAKKTLCDVYGVDYTQFDSLDEAVNYINGYDLEQARKLVDEAYAEALAAGDIRETDVVSLVFGTQTASENMTRQFEFYRDAFVEMCRGTKLEGRMQLTFEAKGTTWATDFRQGKYDICGGGWTGGDWDPGYILICYISSDYTYATAWDTSKHELTATISGLNEYAQVCNDNGSVVDKRIRNAIAKETSKTNPEEMNLSEFELYTSLNQILGYACCKSYSLSYYYKYYPNLFKKDGVDIYQKLNNLMGANDYLLVTPEVKEILKDLAYAYYSSNSDGVDTSWAWYTFCFYKPDEVETTLTMTLTEWYNCLNGISGSAFNWAEGYVSNDARVQIMAALEGEILKQYYSVPLTYRYSADMISYKADYISRNYNVFMTYGGIRYLQYNYTDVEWAELIKEQGGEIDYSK